MSSATVQIDVVSDVVCPWCFIGKRQLEAALQSWQAGHAGEPPPIVRWHPFELNPDLPEQGIGRAQYLQAKFGTSNLEQIYANVRRAAAAIDLTINIDAIARQPNTRLLHALIAAAPDEASQQRIVEALFNAYFIDGADLTDRAQIQSIASNAGFAGGTIDAVLTDPAASAAVADAQAQARRLGISGVPFFIFNQSVAVSGAQGVQALGKAIEQAAAASKSAA